MISNNKNEILQKIEEEGTFSKADNSGGKMEKNEFPE
ncbi:MAG: hypothetical protein ACI8PB_005308 [Desulforhopalus sp.]|jgi:hypothetical protein